MVFFVFVGFLCAHAVDLGHYNFFKTFGLLLRDDSGLDRHGYNGLDIAEDPADCIQTDRGLYFDGATAATLHDSAYLPELVPFPQEFTFGVWVMVYSTGPLITQVDLDASITTFKAESLLGSYRLGVSCWDGSSYAWATTSLVTLTLSTCYLDTWLPMAFEVNTVTGNYFIAHNGFDATQKASVGPFYQSTGQFKTLIGTDLDGNFMKGFIHSAWLSSTSGYDASLYVESSCALEPTAPAGTTPCSYCPVETVQCIAMVTDPLRNAYADACSNLGCPAGCDQTICYTAGSNDIYCDILGCVQCSPECDQCSGPLPTQCVSCTDPAKAIDVLTQECQCASPYISSGNSCILCPSDCATCLSDGVCETCVVAQAIPQTDGTCSCPANSVQINQICECIEEYFYSTISGECQSKFLRSVSFRVLDMPGYDDLLILRRRIRS